MPKRYTKSGKPRTPKVRSSLIDISYGHGGFRPGQFVMIAAARKPSSKVRTNASHYQESIKHVGTFGFFPGKENYIVFTYQDVLLQLLQREMNKSAEARCRQMAHFFNLRKAEALFRKEVQVTPAYGIYKGERVEVGSTCSKKKAQKWFHQNLNRMLGWRDYD